LDNLQFAIEYNLSKDYSKNEGGTGNYASGFFSQLTAVWERRSHALDLILSVQALIA
jgi:hypothetical protein